LFSPVSAQSGAVGNVISLGMRMKTQRLFPLFKKTNQTTKQPTKSTLL